MSHELHCSACGGPLAGPPPTVCGRCGAEHWATPRACANALVLRRGEVLLVRRARSPWQGAWCAPGGFCERLEHPADAAEREVLEETGLRARVTRLLGLWVDGYADAPDPYASTISVAYYLAEPCDDGPPGPVDRAETAEVGWFPLDRLPAPLAPPGTLADVFRAAGEALAGSLRPLLDRRSAQSVRW